MRVIDCVLPQARTEEELHERWVNRMNSEFNAQSRYAHKIEVKHIQLDDNVCKPASLGRTKCEIEGRHSWFNHMVDIKGGSITAR